MHYPLLRLFAGISACLLSLTASAAALIDPTLQQRIAASSGPHEVVITFKKLGDAGALATLAVNFVPLKKLPMAGARLTSAQVQTVRQWASVESIYFNARLRYSNYTSGEITGGHYVHDALAVKGAGTTIAVLDSGIDALHPDLAFGSKTVQNVKLVGDLGVFGVSVPIENVPNTDTTSGHGTHVAGTVGGTGAASAADARRRYYFAGIASNSGPDENTLNHYAIAPWVINVAAGTATKQLADFSSRGVAGDAIKHPDVTAPGNEISSTRAVGTVIGAMGPVVDPAHPEYTLRYHTISGTSMATPFVAGAAALLLSVNPQLSPDQIERILVQTADPMPGWAFHQVGAGYIDVREAVEVATDTPGERPAFLAGDTKWSAQGN